jgi:hypothetical protein
MGHMSALEPTTEVGAVRSRRMCVSAESLLSDDAGSGAMGCMAALDPSWMTRGAQEPLGMWQRQSPPRRRGGI